MHVTTTENTIRASLPVGVGVFLRRENLVFAFRGRHFGLYATRRSGASARERAPQKSNMAPD